MTKRDPWRPISATLYEQNDSDLVQTIVDHTGVSVDWAALDGFSNRTRIRDYKPRIQTIYDTLEDEEKGLFAQTVARRLMERIGEDAKASMLDSLNSIGWTITEDGALTTEDAPLSQKFFGAGTVYDAYVVFRDIFANATGSIVVVDPYIGSELFTTLRALPAAESLSVRLLTSVYGIQKNPDIKLEAELFQQQFSEVKIEIRTTKDFHDRFIEIDSSEYYHVGASIKDAGRKAFMISRIKDAPIINALSSLISTAWVNADVVF